MGVAVTMIAMAMIAMAMRVVVVTGAIVRAVMTAAVALLGGFVRHAHPAFGRHARTGGPTLVAAV